MNSATGATEAQFITNADGSRLTYEWLGLAADGALQVSGGILTVDPNDRYGEIYRLYGTVLGRAPDAAGFNSWTNLAASVPNVTTLAGGFLNSAEYALKYGQPDTGTFVNELYSNALGRAPDAGGFSYYTNYVNSGGSDLNTVVMFSQSQEAINHTTGALADFLYNDNPSGFALAGRSFAADGHLTQDAFSYLDGDTQNDYYLANGQLQTEYFQHAYGNLNVISYDYSGYQWWSRYESDYSATGQWLDNTADVTGGGSLIQSYSQSAADAWWQKVDWFDGSSGSGAWTKEMIDNRDGTSSMIDINPHGAESFSYKIDQYTGPPGTGSLKTEVKVNLNGSYDVTQFAADSAIISPEVSVTSITSNFTSTGNTIGVEAAFNDGSTFSMDFLSGVAVDTSPGGLTGSLSIAGLAGQFDGISNANFVTELAKDIFGGIKEANPQSGFEIRAFRDGYAAAQMELPNTSTKMGFGPGGLGTGTYGSPEPDYFNLD